ncbi:hypothetical protein [Brevundimonas naejangsanensis]|uniref:hypothetical protein n=1 Tax=Brevundimonas naejangsanensis TaxID=588932 RepID=UPI0026EF8BC4|nr:hypothetical protein [Brevundimonas naejangsanensis]
MTPDQLNDSLDAIMASAGEDPNLQPGLIEINSDDWCETLHNIERTAKSLDEGIRHRGVKVAISSAFETRVLTRAEAGDRGEPYRDIAATA